MKKGQQITGKVVRVDFPAKAVVETDEGKCIVKNLIPGQEVTCMVTKCRKGKAEGRLLQVEQKSPVEIDPPCPDFGNCGGCVYLPLPYEEQLKLKEEQVKKLIEEPLSKQEEAWEYEPIKGSPNPFFYRNKMEFSFGDEYKDGPLALGMHKRGSFYDIVTVDHCQIVDEDYRKILRGVLDFFTNLQSQGVQVSFFHRLSHEGYLRHLLVRKAFKTGQILIALVTSSQAPAQKTEADLLEELKDTLLSLELQGSIAGILHIVNDSVADVVQSDRTDLLYGQDYFYEELLGLRFRISTFSFFQTNSLGAEVLYETARRFIRESASLQGKVVFDLYSGTGTIAQILAPVAQKVVGVEIVEEAVEAAKKNAAMNGLDNCEFWAGDVLKVLDEIAEKPDYIVLDPPRDGIHPKALQKIIAYGVEHLVYISCKPTSLARDLESFLAGGYRVEKVTAVDQFPWTANVETVVLLNNKFAKAKDFVQIGIDAEDYYRIKDAKRNE